MYNGLRDPDRACHTTPGFHRIFLHPEFESLKDQDNSWRRRFMSQHSKALAILALGVAIAVTGLALTRQVIAVAGEAGAERLNRSILEYVAQKNPQAPISRFRGVAEVVLSEAPR